MIEWNDSLCIGIKEIDDQHRELVRRFNAFASAAARGDGREDLEEMLLFMKSYAEFHFREEERLMEAVGFPGKTEHVLQHEEFRGRRFWLKEGACTCSADTTRETVEFLEQWIAEHVTVQDRLLGRFVDQAKRPSP